MNLIANVFNKKTLLLGGLLSLSTLGFGQGVGINDDGSIPDTSAMLDLKSTTKGLLIPRMASTERAAISSPATGLMVFDNTTLSFWYYDGSQWTEVGAGKTPFSNVSNVVQPNTDLVDVTSDDFVFGSTQLSDDGNTDHDKRFFFDKSKAAFRAGRATGTEWDDANRGSYSVAFGENNTASGIYATAWGALNTATEDYSTAWGESNTASGDYATTWGESNTASGDYATTWGERNVASGSYGTTFGQNNTASGSRATAWGMSTDATGYISTAWGSGNTASGSKATAWGHNNIASGNTSTAWGYGNAASGYLSTAWGLNNDISGDFTTAWGLNNDVLADYSTAWGASNTLSNWYTTAWGRYNNVTATHATAWGYSNDVTAKYATAWGYNTEASSYLETTFGRYNSTDSTTSTTSWDNSDRLLTVGNGSSSINKSNALTLYKNGTLNINDAYNLPNTDGTAGQTMVSDGAGNLSWASSSNDNLGNHTATTNIKLGNYWLTGDGDDEGIYVASDGKVGVGINTPEHKLDVNGNARVSNRLYFGTAGAFLNGTNQGGSIELGPSQSSGGEIPFIDFHYGNGASQDYNARIINDGDNQLTFKTTAGTAMTIKGTNIGIGTTNPTNGKLDIRGAIYNSSLGQLGYVTSSGSVSSSSSNVDVSIYADNWIVGHRCGSHSDERIKTNRSLSNSTEDLSQLMDIRVTNYQFIDTLQHGNQFEKKVIAQELKEIYPEAVMNDITKVVPDVMEFAEAKEGWVALESHTIKEGETVLLVHANGADEFIVLEIKENAFKVDFSAEEKLLVYGRRVDDFHTVDYNAIAMLNVSATQAQQKLIEQLQKENAALKASEAEFKACKGKTEARLKSLEAVLLQQN